MNNSVITNSTKYKSRTFLQNKKKIKKKRKSYYLSLDHWVLQWNNCLHIFMKESRIKSDAKVGLNQMLCPTYPNYNKNSWIPRIQLLKDCFHFRKSIWNPIIQLKFRFREICLHIKVQYHASTYFSRRDKEDVMG